MNPTQKLLLRLLRGPANFINNNLAKRPGVLGRIGRFWAIGSREYGAHTSTKFLKSINNIYLKAVKYMFSRQTFSKSFFGRQNYANGYFAVLRLYYILLNFTLLAIPFCAIEFMDYERKSWVARN